MVCLDAPEFLGTFWGAIKIGAVPFRQHDPALLGLPAFPGGQPGPRNGGVGTARRGSARIRQAAALEHVLVAGPRVAFRRGRHVARASADWSRRTRRATTRLLAHLRLHRDAEGRRAPPARHGRLRGELRPPGPRHPSDDRVFSAAKLFFATASATPASSPCPSEPTPSSARPTPEGVFNIAANVRSSSGCRRCTRRCSPCPTPPRATTCRHCACACPPARRCPRSCTSGGSTATGSRSSTAWAPPRTCTCACPTAPGPSAPAPRACPSPATTW